MSKGHFPDGVMDPIVNPLWHHPLAYSITANQQSFYLTKQLSCHYPAICKSMTKVWYTYYCYAATVILFCGQWYMSFWVSLTVNLFSNVWSLRSKVTICWLRGEGWGAYPDWIWLRFQRKIMEATDDWGLEPASCYRRVHGLHVEVSLGKIGNPKLHLAWQPPPAVYECVYELL